MRTLSVVFMCLLAAHLCTAQEAPDPSGQTKCLWLSEDGSETYLVLYGDGTFADARGGKKDCRWGWTDFGLLIRYRATRYVFAQRNNKEFLGGDIAPPSGQRAAVIRVTISGEDRAGVLAPWRPAASGVGPSRFEVEAVHRAQQIVSASLSQQGAAAQAVQARLVQAQATFAQLQQLADQQQVQVDGCRAIAAEARRNEDANAAWAHRRPGSSRFRTAIAEWSRWRSRRQAAEADLRQAEGDLGKTQKDYQKALKNLTAAQNEYVIAAADYQALFWQAYRREYPRQRAALEAEHASSTPQSPALKPQGRAQ